MKLRSRTRSRVDSGFSLVELLTVIAIIAILAAITFPVAGSVRENARRTACMSNMRQLTVAIKQYQLDNRKYPEYLFGPAVAGNNMQQAAAAYSAGQDAAGVPVVAPGLYPEYIKSLDVYNCPNNTESRTPGDGSTKSVTKRVEPAGAEATGSFYTYSSYEINPAINRTTLEMDPSTYMVRYSRIWTPIVAVPPTDATLRAAYSRQLYWKNPSDDVYVTMCSYHATKGKVIVAFLNGQTKVLDLAKLNKVVGTGTQDFDMHLFGPTD